MAESKSGKSEVVEKAKQVGGGGGSTGSPMVDLAIKIKKEMEGFYKSESSSTIDLQSMLKDRGFSNLSLDCEQAETVVEVGDAQDIVDIYIKNLARLLQKFPDIRDNALEFFSKWRTIKCNKFVKKEIIFSEKDTSNAAFIGVYMKRGQTDQYLAYKVCKNAFKLAPDIYVVHESQSQSAFWGAFSSTTKRDVLKEMNRGFATKDLALLMEMSSFAVLDLGMINSVQ